MIYKLAIENFLAITKKVEISTEISKERFNTSLYSVSKGKRKLLKTIFLFGDNESGKTSILLALDAIKSIATTTLTPDDTPFTMLPKDLDENDEKHNTTFEIQFFIKDILYSYSLYISNRRIISEKLSYFPNSYEALIYSRKYDKIGLRHVVQFGASLSQIGSKGLSAINYVIDDTTSVLAAYNQVSISNAILDEVWTYFSKSIRSYSRNPTLFYNETTRFTIVLNYFFQLAGLPRFRTDVPPEAPEWVEIVSQSEEGKLLSKGLNTLMDILAEFLIIIKNNKVATFDDFAENLDTKKAYLLLDFFLRFSEESQIFIASHASGLMDYPQLRRDTVRFIIKTNNHSHVVVDSTKAKSVHKTISLANAYNRGLLNNTPPLSPEEIDKIWKHIKEIINADIKDQDYDTQPIE